MNKKIIIAIVVMILILSVLWITGLKKEEINQDFIGLEKSKEIAEEWISENSLTYRYDGFDLKFKEHKEIIENSVYELTFEFKSKNSGYGDRINSLITETITPHNINIVVDRGEIIYAITDDLFSEIDGTIIKEKENKNNYYLYFGKINHEEEVIPVERSFLNSEEVITAVLSSLIDGPTEEEIKEGYFSSINKNTKIQKIEIKNNIIYVDFSSDLEKEVDGSAKVLFIRKQIDETLKQFDNVNDVVISIDKRIDDILQP